MLPVLSFVCIATSNGQLIQQQFVRTLDLGTEGQLEKVKNWLSVKKTRAEAQQSGESDKRRERGVLGVLESPRQGR